jgi:hypothetical protein
LKGLGFVKTDAGISVNEVLKELKAAVREAEKDVTNAMETEHLKERFRNWHGADPQQGGRDHLPEVVQGL